MFISGSAIIALVAVGVFWFIEDGKREKAKFEAEYKALIRSEGYNELYD